MKRRLTPEEKEKIRIEQARKVATNKYKKLFKDKNLESMEKINGKYVFKFKDGQVFRCSGEIPETYTLQSFGCKKIKIKENRNMQVKIDDQNLEAREKTFSTGSRGFYAFGKVVIDGKKYQVSANIVEIGSKKQALKKVS